MSVLGRLVLRTPLPLWRLFPGWLKDIGWLHGQGADAMSEGKREPWLHPRLGVNDMTKAATDSYEEHELHGFCWCQPIVEHTLDGDLYIHRKTLDSPHREVAP